MPPPPPSPKALRSTNANSTASMLGEIVWRGFSFAYGMFHLLSLVGVAAIRDGAFTKKMSADEKKELELGMSSYLRVRALNEADVCVQLRKSTGPSRGRLSRASDTSSSHSGMASSFTTSSIRVMKLSQLETSPSSSTVRPESYDLRDSRY